MTLDVIFHKFHGGGGHILEGMGVCSVQYSLLFCQMMYKKKQENLNKKLMVRKPKGSHW